MPSRCRPGAVSGSAGPTGPETGASRGPGSDGGAPPSARERPPRLNLILLETIRPRSKRAIAQKPRLYSVKLYFGKPNKKTEGKKERRPWQTCAFPNYRSFVQTLCKIIQVLCQTVNKIMQNWRNLPPVMSLASFGLKSLRLNFSPIVFSACTFVLIPSFMPTGQTMFPTARTICALLRLLTQAKAVLALSMVATAAPGFAQFVIGFVLCSLADS